MKGSALARWRVRLGYPLGLACLWLSEPSPESLQIGCLVAVVGLLLRGWAAGHLRKQKALTTSGPYAYTRNPLYLGNVILATGVAVAADAWPVAAIAAVYLAVFYPQAIWREVEELRERYGEAFRAYAEKVPLFWPRFRPGLRDGASFSWAVYEENKEYRAVIGFLLVAALLWLRMRYQ